jgi:hypothetical protein
MRDGTRDWDGIDWDGTGWDETLGVRSVRGRDRMARGRWGLNFRRGQKRSLLVVGILFH